MRSTIYLPNKIKVGFQKRDDTFTGQLAYIIYYDEKGVLRKQKSWDSWRESKIKPQEFENKPMSGFVLNKKVGGYKSNWNYRQSYIRIYDPRGFEFEITLENLLFILENSTCVKGKGLDGEFIYGWDGTDLVLLPVESKDYEIIKHFNETIIRGDTKNAKDLIVGATYLTKDNEKIRYIGSFECIDYLNSLLGKKHVFKQKNYSSFEAFTSSTIKNKGLVQTDDEIIDVNMLIDKFKKQKSDYSSNSFYDPQKHNYVNLSFDEFKKIVNISKINMSRFTDRIDAKSIYRKNKDKYSLLEILYQDNYNYDLRRYNKLFLIGRTKIEDDLDFEKNLKNYFEANGPFCFHYDVK